MKPIPLQPNSHVYFWAICTKAKTVLFIFVIPCKPVNFWTVEKLTVIIENPCNTPNTIDNDIATRIIYLLQRLKNNPSKKPTPKNEVNRIKSKELKCKLWNQSSNWDFLPKKSIFIFCITATLLIKELENKYTKLYKRKSRSNIIKTKKKDAVWKTSFLTFCNLAEIIQLNLLKLSQVWT